MEKKPESPTAEGRLEPGPENLDFIRESLSYAQRYKGSTFVLKIDSPVIDHPFFPTVLQDIVLLSRAGVRMVLVPGVRERLEAVLAEYGIEHPLKDGVRITRPEALPFVEMVAFSLSNRIMAGLGEEQLRSLIGTWVRAKSRGIIEGVDFQLTGTVERVEGEPLRRMLAEGFVPILPPLGWSGSGRTYSLSADELAVAAASALNADKLLFIGSHPAIPGSAFRMPSLRSSGSEGPVNRLTVEEARELCSLNAQEVERQSRAGERSESGRRQLLERIEAGCRACESGVSRVHIVDGTRDGVLLKEVFSNIGSGLMIHSNTFASIRPMERSDISDVLHLMEPFIQEKKLVPRDAESLGQLVHDYVVYDVDGTVHGCAALHQYPGGQAEIAAVAVNRSFARLGIGKQLVEYLLQCGRERGLRRIFALTTQAADWFERLGFREAELSDIPEKKRAAYDIQRNSKVLVYDV
jgi:amino-acid N-acetyltransferase